MAVCQKKYKENAHVLAYMKNILYLCSRFCHIDFTKIPNITQLWLKFIKQMRSRTSLC